MANSSFSHVGDGTTTAFSMAFKGGYLDSSHIEVYVDDLLVETGFNFDIENVLTFDTAPAADVKVFVRRRTPTTNIYSSFSYANMAKPANMNIAFNQVLMAVQEIEDGYSSDIAGSTTGVTYLPYGLNLSGSTLTGVPTPIADDDAANKLFVETSVQTLSDAVDVEIAAISGASAASETQQGSVERATQEEFDLGEDTTRYVTPAQVASLRSKVVGHLLDDPIWADQTCVVALTLVDPIELKFTSDGMKMFVLTTTRTLIQYDLTESYNVSTATAVATVDLSADMSSVISFDVDNLNKDKIYIMEDQSSPSVYEYTLNNSNNDISGMTFTVTHSGLFAHNEPRAFYFTNDGDYAWGYFQTGKLHKRIALNTPYDLADTGTVTDFDMSGVTNWSLSNMTGVAASADGSITYMADQDYIRNYYAPYASIGINNPLSTTFQVPAILDGDLSCIAISADGAKVFVLGRTTETIMTYYTHKVVAL